MKFGNKKIIKIVMCMFLILGATQFLKVPVTYSAFQDEEDNVLVYRSKLHNLYYPYKMTLKNATIDFAKFEFTFIPNSAEANHETDKYDITIPSNCTFNDADGGVNAGTRVDSTTHSITFDKNSNRDMIIIGKLICDVTPNKKLDYTVKIKETVDNQQPFLYIDYTYVENYSNYLDHVYTKVEDSEIIENTSGIYDKFIAWITQYGNSVGYPDDILLYVKSVFPNEAAIKDPNKFNSLLGFSITYDSAKNEYTYQILENFIGYARTYRLYVSSSFKNGGIVYFSTQSRGILYQAFENYLNKYLYPNNKEAVKIVSDYVSDNNRLYDVVFNGATVYGLLLKENKSGNISLQVQMTNLLSTAGTYIKKIPYLVYGDSKDMDYNYYQALTTLHSNLSASMIDTIYKREDIYNSIIKTKVAFTDYFIQKDGNRSLLIKVFSDGKTYNTFTITPISVPSDMTISFENSGNNLIVQIKHTGKTSVMSTVSDLNGYFNTSIEEKDIKVLKDIPNEYSIEYIITK